MEVQAAGELGGAAKIESCPRRTAREGEVLRAAQLRGAGNETLRRSWVKEMGLATRDEINSEGKSPQFWEAGVEILITVW